MPKESPKRAPKIAPKLKSASEQLRIEMDVVSEDLLSPSDLILEDIFGENKDAVIKKLGPAYNEFRKYIAEDMTAQNRDWVYSSVVHEKGEYHVLWKSGEKEMKLSLGNYLSPSDIEGLKVFIPKKAKFTKKPKETNDYQKYENKALRYIRSDEIMGTILNLRPGLDDKTILESDLIQEYVLPTLVSFYKDGAKFHRVETEDGFVLESESKNLKKQRFSLESFDENLNWMKEKQAVSAEAKTEKPEVEKPKTEISEPVSFSKIDAKFAEFQHLEEAQQEYFGEHIQKFEDFKPSFMEAVKGELSEGAVEDVRKQYFTELLAETAQDIPALDEVQEMMLEVYKTRDGSLMEQAISKIDELLDRGDNDFDPKTWAAIKTYYDQLAYIGKNDQ